MEDAIEYLHRLLFYAGADPEEYKDCKAEMSEINRKRLTGYLKVSAGVCFVMMLLSLVLDIISENFLAYAGMSLCSVIMASILNVYGKNNPWIVRAGRILFNALIGVVGIVIGTINSPNKQATTAIVLIVLLPMLFVVPPIANITQIFIYDVLFIFFAIQTKQFYGARMDIVNAVSFFFISAIVSTYLMTSMVENVITTKKLHLAAKKDFNTGLRNRNAYENESQNYSMRCTNTLSCVYLDVNGLHELNNVKGHAEGDRMLQIVAEKLVDTFGENESYRIGGDEFVAFVLDESHERMTELVDEFVAAVDKAGYSVAVGTATSSAGGIDVSDLVKTAEKRMYMAKQEYYQKNFPNRTDKERLR